MLIYDFQPHALVFCKKWTKCCILPKKMFRHLKIMPDFMLITINILMHLLLVRKFFCSKAHPKREAYAQVILAKSSKYCRLPHETEHNIRSAQCNPSRVLLWKEARSTHVRIFGSIAYVHIPDKKRQNLDPKSEKCILVGYSLEQKGYKCFHPSTQKVRVSWDVVFD